MQKILSKLENIYKWTDCSVEVLVLLSLAFYIIGISLNFSNVMMFPIFSTISKILIRLSFAFIILTTGYTIVTYQFDLKVSLFLIVLGILLIINYYFARDGRLLQIYCYCISAKNINPKKILRVALISISLTLMFVLILRIFNVIPDIRDYMTRSDGAIRYGLGFYVANVTSYHYLTIVLLYIYQRCEKVNLPEIIIMFVINFIIFSFTKTRNSFIATNMAILLVLILNYAKSQIFVEILEKLTIVSYILGSIIIFALSILYGIGNSFAMKLNETLTGRLALSWKGIQRYVASLAGQNVVVQSGEYNVIDSSYVNCFVIYGIIFFIIMLIFFTTFAYFSYKAKDRYLSLCLFIIAYYSIFDGAWLMFGYDSFPSIYLTILVTAFPNLKQIFYNRKVYTVEYGKN